MRHTSLRWSRSFANTCLKMRSLAAVKQQQLLVVTPIPPRRIADIRRPAAASSHSRDRALRTTSSAAPATTTRQLQTWQGLNEWRANLIDNRRHWGEKKEPVMSPEIEQLIANTTIPSTLAECGRQVLLTPHPLDKAVLTHAAWQAYCAGHLPIGQATAPDIPARPEKPELVPPKQIPSMKKTTLPINVYMLHNLTHVEANAIDLAMDTVVRFSGLGLPDQFYADFAKVADDESRHLRWCIQRLRELGYDYGCMPAHNLLWEGCELSTNDIKDRLAIVPMSQEARGLDAGGRLTDRLVGFGDNRSAAIVARITKEESAHVAVGVAWFRAICEALEFDAGQTFKEALQRLCPDLLKPPFNHEAREEVGLQREWYDPSLWINNSGTDSLLNNKGAGGDDLADLIKKGASSSIKNEREMELLRQRLHGMLESEVQVYNS